jgi:hypothetical protein
MSIEYIAAIAEEDYGVFKILVSTALPREYDMWLRVRERGKLRAMQEREAVTVEVAVRPEEIGAYCKSLKRPDCKYPPAGPGALVMGPLEAAVGVADAAPIVGPPRGGDQRHRLS